MDVAEPGGVAPWITGAEITWESRVMAICFCSISLVRRAHVSEPLGSPAWLNAKLISIWLDCGLKPPVIARLVSICSPVRRGPSASVTPLSRGTSSRSSGWPDVGSQETRGRSALSEPASGSVIWPMQRADIKVSAANCSVGSVD